MWPLLHPDGSITTEVIHSVRVPKGGKSITPSYARGALTTTVHTYLSTFSVRSTPDYDCDASSIRGIDFISSYASTVNSIEGISVPLLQLGMTGNYGYFAAETIRAHAKSADKTLAYVEGARHGFHPCTACALAQGKPANY